MGDTMSGRAPPSEWAMSRDDGDARDGRGGEPGLATHRRAGLGRPPSACAAPLPGGSGSRGCPRGAGSRVGGVLRGLRGRRPFSTCPLQNEGMGSDEGIEGIMEGTIRSDGVPRDRSGRWPIRRTGTIRSFEEFRANRGKVGGNFERQPLLLLHHRGARTGVERVNPVAYQKVGDSYAVFASRVGRRRTPIGTTTSSPTLGPGSRSGPSIRRERSGDTGRGARAHLERAEEAQSGLRRLRGADRARDPVVVLDRVPSG